MQIKNYPGVAYIEDKRESRRLLGDIILKELIFIIRNRFQGWKNLHSYSMPIYNTLNLMPFLTDVYILEISIIYSWPDATSA
ncbi:hypothetical protein EZS27_021687 [termite gut metagenome]|uniref:Uncharacterized protein n=1 Tax=termite gut metagenome TaxID=433724 RepID=A0A5J4R5S2_9ZZZZ